jgi:hypothetical protein
LRFLGLYSGHDHEQHQSIIAEWLEISCAKRRKIVQDGLTAASMQQIFACAEHGVDLGGESPLRAQSSENR